MADAIGSSKPTADLPVRRAFSKSKLGKALAAHTVAQGADLSKKIDAVGAGKPGKKAAAHLAAANGNTSVGRHASSVS